MNLALPFGPDIAGLLALAFVVGYGALVHYWPQIKTKLPGLGRELDRENADLDNFLKNAHTAIDNKIADLQKQKAQIASAVSEVKKAAGQ